eukprot:GHVR01086351.1.p1 GENE.GHVR01086351.1~~GHVR01086351.1.p1  ORF type:complete len:386 (+),score=86.46 GHVR01086351.1:523-1680(+)
MESRENLRSVVAHRTLYRMLYPDGCSYAREQGGLLSDLRSLSNEDVINYHRYYYHWNNLTIIVIGNIDIYQLLNTVQLSEESIGPMEAPNNWKRPFISCNIPNMISSSRECVVFPSVEEGTGCVAIGWRGPKWDDFLSILGLEVLGVYLCDGNVSPLESELVMGHDSSCSASGLSLENFLETCIVLQLEDVICDKMEEAVPKVFKVLSKACEDINMDRLKAIIRRERNATLRELEEDPHETLADVAICYAVNGHTHTQLVESLEIPMRYSTLLSMDISYWQGLMKQWLLDAPHADVLCRPSSKENKKLAREKEKRRKNNLSNLGTKDKEKIEAILKKKLESTNVPEQILTEFPSVELTDVNPVKLNPVDNFTNTPPPPTHTHRRI